MLKQNDNAETIEIRFIVKGRPDEMKVLAAKWMRSNKFEALDFLLQARKAEIIADEGATRDQIQGAKIESLAFFKYWVEVLTSQIAIGKGMIPEITTPVITPSIIPPSAMDLPSQPVELPASLGADDDELILTGILGGNP
jgi:hypothetical protein